ncbi:MAG: T9SS type A sorting domain-containing protein [Saprospiraceae bacterium]|uniref:T9SS type A sorting domain-containing protein n=1 Tax=Candidatus Defluviibacterium haderslevense TaxID=2981993 RepID=A0A9D7SB52_9BACT|nr:T9SS type A sorting domain-containing protein [Candidatus Defluviibacterium haderslevense]
MAYDRSGKIQVDTVSGRVEIANVNSIASNGIHPFRINANPVHDQIIIEYHDIQTRDVEVHLYDLSGKEVTINVDNENQRIKINVKEICNGMYLLKLNSNGKNSVMKIFIQH